MQNRLELPFKSSEFVLLEHLKKKINKQFNFQDTIISLSMLQERAIRMTYLDQLGASRLH